MIFVIEYINSLVIDIVVVDRLEYNINITWFFSNYKIHCLYVVMYDGRKYN